MNRLEGRTALVTGGSRGIGRAIVERLANFGLLDILVNNAAIPSGGAAFDDATEERYDRVMAVNAKAVFFLIQEAARRMRDGGRIVNVSTINTVMPTQRIGLYAASKGAVEQFTAIAAAELAPRRITVNTVSPGFTDTDLLRASSGPEALPGLAALDPQSPGRFRLDRRSKGAGRSRYLGSLVGGWGRI